MSMFGFVFFKQKTAYEMRISDWSSDVCSSDLLPGITRRRRGRYWQYFDAKGERITDRDEIDRLNGVGLPPAYKDAWFCPSPEGHIQAIGYDDRGRKQYRYHPERSEEHTSELQSLMRISYAVFCLKKKTNKI